MSEPIVPIFDPDRGFRSWNIREIYRGPEYEGRYVPNTDDLVLDWDNGLYRVVGVDLSTGLSRLERWNFPGDDDGMGETDILLGVDIAAQGESYRVYLDNSVTPHTLACDSRLHIFGTTASSIKIFQGTKLGEDGTVISAMYDPNGVFLGENIPLELVAMPDHHNVAVKTPVVGYTLKKLQDGEVVTAVVYDDAGYAISYSTLLVKNTAFIRTTEASRKYITGIHLESPFLNEKDDRLLQLPTNLAVKDVPATGVVTYSDGSKLKLPADGGKFNLYGLDHFVSTIVGQKIPLVLSYRLDEDEFCYGAQPGFNKHISEEYWGTTTEFEEAFSIKLYAFPRWVDDVRGYTLDFYLYTLDRSHVWGVTPYVGITSNSPSFQPHRYGEKQKLTFYVDMDKVDPRYPPFRHVQTMEVTLMSPGSDRSTNWLVGFTPNQNPPYGMGLAARATFINADLWRLKLDNGFHSKEEWLRHLYYATEPLHNYNTETMAPPPNIFVVKMRYRDYEFPIDRWNEELEVINDREQGDNVIIEFIHRVYENDLQLGIAAIPLHEEAP